MVGGVAPNCCLPTPPAPHGKDEPQESSSPLSRVALARSLSSGFCGPYFQMDVPPLTLLGLCWVPLLSIVPFLELEVPHPHYISDLAES